MICKKGEPLGVVEAVNAETAIKVTAERFGITDPQRQRRLAATRIEETSGPAFRSGAVYASHG